MNTEKQNVKKRWTFFRVMMLVTALVIIGVFVFAGAAWHKYRQVCKSNAPVEMIGTVSRIDPAENPGEAVIGDPVMFALDMRVPWSHTPDMIRYEAPEGIQITAGPEFIFEKYGWGANVWRAFVTVQAYRDGDLKLGEMDIIFDKGDVIRCTLPGLKAVLSSAVAATDNTLAVAGEIPPREETSPAGAVIGCVIGLLIILLVILTLRDYFRRRSLPAPPLPPCEKAVNAVRRLRDAVHAGAVSAESSVAMLTDIVRHYLEKRFSLRAERQTTAEFLKELDQDDSPLHDNDRRFLKKFMVAADMVKYARIQSDPEAFDAAADRAEKLILGTVPGTDSKKEKKEVGE